MAQQIINTGAVPNDNSGDPLRIAFNKCNDNFSELFESVEANGYLYVPAISGAPSGPPVTVTGKLPLVIDSLNNKLYFYSGGSWRNVGP